MPIIVVTLEEGAKASEVARAIHWIKGVDKAEIKDFPRVLSEDPHSTITQDLAEWHAEFVKHVRELASYMSSKRATNVLIHTSTPFLVEDLGLTVRKDFCNASGQPITFVEFMERLGQMWDHDVADELLVLPGLGSAGIYDLVTIYRNYWKRDYVQP